MQLMITCIFRLDNVTVRLFGSTKHNEGKVEVYDEGEWRVICDDSWDIDDATVVCRQLGYGRAASAKWNQRDYYWTGRKVWMDNVRCRGIENNLKQCSFARWSSNDNEICDPLKTAGVACGKSIYVVNCSFVRNLDASKLLCLLLTSAAYGFELVRRT